MGYNITEALIDHSKTASKNYILNLWYTHKHWNDDVEGTYTWLDLTKDIMLYYMTEEQVKPLHFKNLTCSSRESHITLATKFFAERIVSDMDEYRHGVEVSALKHNLLLSNYLSDEYLYEVSEWLNE